MCVCAVVRDAGVLGKMWGMEDKGSLCSHYVNNIPLICMDYFFVSIESQLSFMHRAGLTQMARRFIRETRWLNTGQHVLSH